MKAVRTDRSNAVLTLPGGTEENDLPVERIRIVTGDEDVSTPMPDTADSALAGADQPGFESTWQPDEGERRAIANGAPILLRVWGKGHPPVNVLAGEPVELRALISKAHADRAVGFWFAKMSAAMEDDGVFPEPDAVLEYWQEALEETRELKDDGPENPPISSNGNGKI